MTKLVVRTEVRELLLRPTRRTLVLYPKGRPGRDAERDSIAPIAFSFGDATPDAIYTAPADGTFTYARLAIETAFNGAGSSMAFGVTGSLSALLAADQSDTTEVGEFENTPDVHVTAGTQAFISITPGVGASQGAGRVYLQFVPD